MVCATTGAACPPFICWTLQRTGGSNLAQHLMGYAGPPYGLQEPFLQGRELQAILADWRHDEDAVALRRQMARVCADGLRIKHCVETVPEALNLALLNAARVAGYRHVFIYRRSALDRLLSLHFATNTGIWGPEERRALAQDAGPLKAVLARPLPVARLIAHQKECVRRLNECWQLLQSAFADPFAIAYEDVYVDSGAKPPVARLGRLLDYLALSKDPARDAAWADAVVTQGDQETRDQYAHLPGIEALSAALIDVPQFHADRP